MCEPAVFAEHAVCSEMCVNCRDRTVGTGRKAEEALKKLFGATSRAEGVKVKLQKPSTASLDARAAKD